MREYRTKKNPHNPTNRLPWNNRCGVVILTPQFILHYDLKVTTYVL